WLLIWDNVEELDLVRRFLPVARSGALLFTSRRRVVGTLARGLDLCPMEQEEALLFLLRRAKVLSPEAPTEEMQEFAGRMPTHYAAGEELVAALGGLPLALDQAGAYLEATQCGLPAYLDLFDTQRVALLKLRGEGAQDHPASVSTTFTLALTTTAEHHPAVWDLLHICALLQPDAIPEEIFQQSAQHLGTTLEVACRDPLEWNQVVAVACSSSLLSRHPEKQTFSLHRLVQAVLLDTMNEAEQEQWRLRVIAALDAVFPETRPVTEYALRKQYDRLLPHALHCLRQAGLTEESLMLASLAYKTAHALYARGQYAEAESLHLRALSIREQALGPDHPHVAASLHYLAVLYWAQAKYAKAEPLYLRALHIWEQAHGPNHPDVAYALNNLANLYYKQGRYAEAEALSLKALHIREQTLGPEHPGVAISLLNLGNFYDGQGKYAEAEALSLRALHIWEQAHGPNHPDVAYPLNNLARLYQKQGEYAEAEPLYLRALHIWEQALGSNHPLAAHPLNNLADLYRKQGKDAEAEAFYQRALSIREQQLGSQHPDTAETLYSLALFRQQQGNLNEALSYAKRALLIYSQSLGDVHTESVATRALYDQLLQEQAGTKAEMGAQRRSQGRQESTTSLPLHEEIAAPSPQDDPLQGFLDACCELHPLAWCRSADLWRAYKGWVEEHRERYSLSRGAFIAQVKAHGGRADRTRRARIWRGIALVSKNSDGG
ncbi:MAG TPA: tetratricopeptide repeat protein, partial [Ktedonobacteraceae bacterium]